MQLNCKYENIFSLETRESLKTCENYSERFFKGYIEEFKTYLPGFWPKLEEAMKQNRRIYHLLIYFWLVLEQTPRDFYWEKRSQQLATKDEMGLWEEALTALGNNDSEWFSLVALYIRREFGREPSAPRG
ncbi:uncharacterized protein CXQ87_003430 [Candidozyma duobushaemuli]|uniref:Uncharacterized protein n=1 Tax=Candidozyma duobushaemuli TaxID=1231522 RepID=A0A2V1ADI7_9ASCO|nr:uncharacterized protein CXQ87_003430 [[Candida] duobushaemulonis]PVH15584.1 hypothetical protein CXQ87_003430 [[Candida] duobushaemulonis]